MSLPECYVGTQFVFIDADQKHPCNVSVKGQQQVVTRRTILSRYRQEVSGPQCGFQPALTLPRLDVAAVVTDRKIYKPGEKALAITIGPGLIGTSQQVLWNGSPICERPCEPEVLGVRVDAIEGLQEGTYEVRLLDERGVPLSSCEFTVAQYTLSLLQARLESFSIEAGRLEAALQVTLLGAPFEGAVRLGLACGHCEGRILRDERRDVREGHLSGRFALEHPGPFHLRITTDAGDTASVFLPGTAEAHREVVRVGAVGRPLEASAAPFPGSVERRGIYFSEGEPSDAPVVLVSPFGDTGEVRVTALPAQVVVIDPRTEWHKVYTPEEGVVRFPVEAPYVLVHAAAWPAKGQPYETFGVVVRPPSAEVFLEAPAQASPGDAVTLRLRGTGTCLLVVSDARLEREEPLPKQGQKLFEHLGGAARSCSEAVVSAYRPQPMPVFRARGGAVWAAARPAAMALDFGPPMLECAMDEMAMPEAAEAFQAVEAPPARQDFPEMLACELFELEGEAERTVKLGDQITTYRAVAYLFYDVDAASSECRIEARKDVFAEMDLPAILAPGEKVQAAVRYDAGPGATLTLTTARTTQRHEVAGRGMVELPLDGPGEVLAQIGSDLSSRTVKPPGRQTVVASRLLTLKAGEEVSGLRVVVYPSTGSLTKDAVQSLIQYPFG